MNATQTTATATVPVLGPIVDADTSTLYHGYRQPGSGRTRVFWIDAAGDGLLPGHPGWRVEFDWGCDGAGSIALARALLESALGRSVDTLEVMAFHRDAVRRMAAEWDVTADQILAWWLAWTTALAGGAA